ncbi:MAG: Mbeg1-like protein [Pseudomonadota bacterium]
MSASNKHGIVLLLALILVGCGSPSDSAEQEGGGKQKCEDKSDDKGLINCSIAMDKQLTELVDDPELSQCKCSYEKRFSFFEEDIQVLDQVAEENYVYAVMSANAYDKGFQVEIPGWTREQRVVTSKGLSADIYLSNDRRRAVIAYRGTDDLPDWLHANADFNSHEKGQYRDAVHVWEKASAMADDLEITTVGHSLGGGLAMHVAVTNENVNAVVFNPSPRLFIPKDAKRYENDVQIIYETGEILTVLRYMFSTLGKVKHSRFKFNYLGGNIISEHSMPKFARCMYVSTLEDQSRYASGCKDNTL